MVYFTKKKVRKRQKTYRSISDSNQFVSHTHSAIHMSCTTFHNFSDVDAIVSRNVLIPYTTSNTESQAFVAFDKFHFNQLHIRGTLTSLHTLWMRRIFRNYQVGQSCWKCKKVHLQMIIRSYKNKTFLYFTYQANSIASTFKGFNCCYVGNIYNSDIINRNNDICNLQPAISCRCTSWYQLGDVDGGVRPENICKLEYTDLPLISAFSIL